MLCSLPSLCAFTIYADPSPISLSVHQIKYKPPGYLIDIWISCSPPPGYLIAIWISCSPPPGYLIDIWISCSPPPGYLIDIWISCSPPGYLIAIWISCSHTSLQIHPISTAPIAQCYAYSEIFNNFVLYVPPNSKHKNLKLPHFRYDVICFIST